MVGERAHVAGVFDPANAKVRIYVDGVLTGESVAAFTEIADTNGSFRVGSDQQMEGFRQAVNGAIDEVTVWSRALTTAELVELEDRPPTSGRPGLAASWLFEDPAGTRVADSSRNANDATLPTNVIGIDTGLPARSTSIDVPAAGTSPLDPAPPPSSEVDAGTPVGPAATAAPGAFASDSGCRVGGGAFPDATWFFLAGVVALGRARRRSR